MSTTSLTRLEGILRRTGIFSENQITALTAGKMTQGESITDLVVNKGYANEETFLEALAKALAVPFVRLADFAGDAAVLESLPTKVVFDNNVMPVSKGEGVLVVATRDPFNSEVVDALRLAAGMRVRTALCTASDIAKAMKKFYGVGADTVEKMMEDDRIEVDLGDALFKSDLADLDQGASIVKFVNQIIWEAYMEQATDIHLEPMEESLRIRSRVDGLLHPISLPPQLNRFQAAIISRIKVMANMDIAEKRLPQDGRIGLRIQGEDIDIRVSTMPTVYGESVSLRLLMRGKGLITIGDLGMCEKDAVTMRKMINRPNGIILVTGPTGSGKSTSLYAYLHEINSIDQRILTIEDPIEYEMAGINQVQLKEDIGLTFASALRTFLRQDPDVIMVGEVRDFETAEIAIRASLTGHLVFSTLHTNDAAGAATRLLDMGVEPFLVASAVRAIVAQRLIRKLCAACRQPARPDLVFLRSAGFPMDRIAEANMCDPVGCDACRSSGYKGRTGMYEVLLMTELIESLVIARASTSKIRQAAITQGMRTLRADGWEKVLAGVTSVDEVVRASEESD